MSFLQPLNFWQTYRQRRQREHAEDALKHIHACEWRGQTASADSLAGALHLSAREVVRLIEQMETQGWLVTTPQGLRLTPDGEQQAVAVIRAHRLWERYLADEARMPLAQIHAEAERREHQSSPEILAKFEAELGHPWTDPHGDPIPTAAGKIENRADQPLTAWQTNAPLRITHIEDEPPAIFAQIVAAGLRPGHVIRILTSTAERMVISNGDDTPALAPIVAANISAELAPNAPTAATQLTSLQMGESAIVAALDPALQGFTRRRLLDLGLTPGTRIQLELPSMFRDPLAYRVRGTLIALRKEQAEWVYIEKE
ncbi:MAG TPA: metal-dependent transcriptional regulator [Anaerolineales bacterium]|nr:metal-dependent transcriptional regulator [Anaerolineales bacterium]